MQGSKENVSLHHDGGETMLKKKIEECIALTDRIMTEHFRGSDELLKRHIGEDCLWIGSCDSEYYAGKETILAVLDAWRGDLPKITLFSKSFECVVQDRNSCTIVGRYVGATDENSGEIFSDKQRVTFCWKEQDHVLKVEHMHVSNPMKNVSEEEVFPHEVGKYTRQYMKMLIEKEIKRMGSICVKDNDNVNHKILVGEIIYLEAFDRETLIHTTHGDICAKLLMSSVEEIIAKEQPELIIRVHKSYCASRYYAESIKRYELKLYGGHMIPISRSSYPTIKDRLQLRETYYDRGKNE